jgi:dimethylglycine dehydrogenase
VKHVTKPILTSGGYGHVVGASLAMGYLDVRFSGKRDGYSIDLLGERRSARVLSAPPYDSAGERMRG